MAVLIKTSFDYADEFDCQEVAVMEDDEYSKWIKAWENILNERAVEVYFGTNEQLDINSFAEFKEGLEVLEITDTEYKTFNKFFGDGSWGTGGIFSFDEAFARMEDDEESEPSEELEDWD